MSVSDGNITNVGVIEADTIQSDADAAGLNINFDGNTGTNKLSLTDNLASALDITESSYSYIKFVTTNSSVQIVFGQDGAHTRLSLIHISETTRLMSIWYSGMWV